MSTVLLGGAAKASIAPRVEDLAEGVYLGGFGSYRQRRASGIHDEPWCRAVALSDGVNTFVLAALDLVGASGPLLAAIREDAARLTGLAPANIVISCTHSHASPDLQGLWGGVPASYRTHVAHRAASAIWEAWQSMAPVRLSASTTTLAGVVRNRRGWPETDETLTSVSVRTASGDPVASIVNYACHPTASGAANTEVSRDWVGYAVDAIERGAGGIAIYVNGAIGDVNPARNGGFDGAEALGLAVAAASIAASEGAEEIGGAVRVRTEPLELPVNVERLSQRVEQALGRAGFALNVLARAGGLRAASVALHTAGRGDLAQLVAALEGMSERKLVHRDGRTFV
ncbi:MAG TPA: neutral/alkaline non-lysosomal ceramidase N-terminal domain-containing protein, partial [Dehalococcoidia bacterium]